MVPNNRKYPRIEVEVDVVLSFGDSIKVVAQTRNISDGGMFMNLSETEQFPLGDMVIVSFDDPLNNNKQTTKDAVIVRVAEHGIAIAYVDLNAF